MDDEAKNQALRGVLKRAYRPEKDLPEDMQDLLRQLSEQKPKGQDNNRQN